LYPVGLAISNREQTSSNNNTTNTNNLSTLKLPLKNFDWPNNLVQTLNSVMPSRTCCNCTQSIISLQEPGKSNTSVQILFSLHCSHQHDFCAICFSEISAARGCDFFLSCHQCKEVEQVKTWNVEKVVTTKTSQAQFEEGRSSRSGKHKSRRVIIEKEEEAILQLILFQTRN